MILSSYDVGDREPFPEEWLRRVGRVSIARDLILHAPGKVALVLAGLLVVRAELSFVRDTVEYEAFCLGFEPISPGAEPPRYEAIITPTEDGLVANVVWRRSGAP